MNQPTIKDDIQQYMVDKTGYFVDIATEMKWMVLPNGWINTEATQAEMNLWDAFEGVLRAQRASLDNIVNKVDVIAGKLEQYINAKRRANVTSTEQHDSD